MANERVSGRPPNEWEMGGRLFYARCSPVIIRYIGEMNHFSLFAHGENFDVDAYLTESLLTFDRVWRRGNLRGCSKFIQDEYPTSGVEKTLGDGKELTVSAQQQIASEFLEANEESLIWLSGYLGVDTFFLGIHHRVEVASSTTGFCISSHRRLMYWACRICIDIVTYVELDHDDDGYGGT